MNHAEPTSSKEDFTQTSHVTLTASLLLLLLFLVCFVQDKVYIYSLDGDTLVPKTEKEHRGPVMDVAYSPDGAYLAACNAQRQVQLYTLPNYDVSRISSITV